MNDSTPIVNDDFEPRIVGFVCNWSAYSGVEMAGLHRMEYPASVRFVRLPCLGRLHLGLILKAFELGADGVVLLGCPQDDCHYDQGMTKAKELLAQAGEVLHLLGIEPFRLSIIEVPIGGDAVMVKQVSNFVKRITEAGSKCLRSGSETVQPKRK